MWLNFGFLLLTTMVPFTTNLVSSHGDLSVAVTLYACNLLLLYAALWVRIRHLRGHPELATAELSAPPVGRSIERRLALFCAIAAVAMIVAQASPEWGMRSFGLLLVIHFLPHHKDSRAETGVWPGHKPVTFALPAAGRRGCLLRPGLSTTPLG